MDRVKPYIGREESWNRVQPTSKRSNGVSSFGRLSLILLFIFFFSYNPFDTSFYSFDKLRFALTPLSSEPHERAVALIKQYPIIDLPILTRAFFQNQLSEINLREPTKGQVDIPRLREGGVGGYVWSVYVPCPEDAGYPDQNASNFTDSTWRVISQHFLLHSDTLEQIDIARLMIEKFSDVFELTTTARSFRKAIQNGKIAGFLGVEGGHQLGNSLSTLRMYYSLGVRYVTLTHTCHNALGDSCGMQGSNITPRWNGLSPFGELMIKESNRLGMILDLSHTHPSTASDALSLSLSPPIFSHSNARGLHDVVRNVPDTILRRIGSSSKSKFKNYDYCNSRNLDGEGGLGWGNDTGEAERLLPSGDALIALNFSPPFITDDVANVQSLADHADYIGCLAGREHVGIGSDFDGIATVPEELEDVSKYPNLISELIKRGWSDNEIAGLTGENFLRVMAKVELVAHNLRHEAPVTDLYNLRTDMKRIDHY